jgi:hypothetical protein
LRETTTGSGEPTFLDRFAIPGLFVSFAIGRGEKIDLDLEVSFGVSGIDEGC